MPRWESVNRITVSLQIFYLIVALASATARIVDKCEVARAIRDHTTIKGAWNIKQLVCIADQVSQNLNADRSDHEAPYTDFPSASCRNGVR